MLIMERKMTAECDMHYFCSTHHQIGLDILLTAESDYYFTYLYVYILYFHNICSRIGN